MGKNWERIPQPMQSHNLWFKLLLTKSSLNDLHLGLICRCLGTQYQIPILLSETEISEKRKIELEEELGKLLDSKTSDAEAGNVSGRLLGDTARLDGSDALVSFYLTFFRKLPLTSTQPQL